MRKVDIIIPTFRNPYWLRRCLTSLSATRGPEIEAVIIVDNGGDFDVKQYEGLNLPLSVIKPGRNLGWTSGIVEGLKHCSWAAAAASSEFVMFLNDDTEFERIPGRITALLSNFEDESIGMVGPATGIAMGKQALDGPDVEDTKLLIGFCQLMKRGVLEKIGGLDERFQVGGDDFDLCIRLSDAGYRLVIDRRVFVYHHAFKTGNRLYGNSHIPGGWNSQQMATAVYDKIAEKHGRDRLMELILAPDYHPQTISIH